MKLHMKQAARQKQLRRSERRTGRTKLPRLTGAAPFPFAHLNALVTTAVPWVAR